MDTLYSYPAGAIVNGQALAARTALPPCVVVIDEITHGPEICEMWTSEALVELGIKKVVCAALPVDANGWPYLPGEPVDVEGETEIQRSYPNAAPDTEGWAAHLETLATAVRTARDAKLTACDWTQLADSPLAADLKASWATYRQALRDITTQAAFPVTVEWPSAPAEA
jgi:hypothetical protein